MKATNDYPLFFLPEFLNGIANKETFDLNNGTAKNWTGRVVHTSRLPVIGMLTSLTAALLNIIRLIFAAVAFPFLILTALFLEAKSTKTSIGSTLTLVACGMIGITIGSLLWSVTNIATLGILNWRVKATFIPASS